MNCLHDTACVGGQPVGIKHTRFALKLTLLNFFSGQSLHMTGTLSGSINDINFDKIRFSVFGDAPSKTTYIALDAVPPSIGVPLRVLTPMVSTLGFLFAHPGESTGNGFSFLGDDFSRRAKITFDTGE